MLSTPDGRVDPGGRTFQALTITAGGGTFQPGLLPIPPAAAAGPAGPAHAFPKPGTDGRYTLSPHEVPTKNTVPFPRDVVAMLRAGWSELTEQGARTLTAQFLHETGGGKYCFNWNLATCTGLVYIASAEEIRRRGWTTPGKTVTVFEPPHPYSRFIAYPSLAEGAARWMGRHKWEASKHPQYVTYANAGDCTKIAYLLKVDHYYTGNEGAYARSMVSKKVELDHALGPAS